MSDLTAQQICAEFAVQYGQTFHDKYQKRYPISATTKLENVVTDALFVTYLLPHIPGSMTVTHRTVNFERWGMPDDHGTGFIVALAYAPEIDTLFVRRTK